MSARLYRRLWLWATALERRCWAWHVAHNRVGELVAAGQARAAQRQSAHKERTEG